ncbi:hypothetical protein TNCT_701061 [Trichonephila clavata]|uniref:Uncharacterized protein n=1 Tax=Trichonephila clavata TaxID=2740835 RepID=A0A8X6KZK4_TRICU|nr:hypothetical protein TNCT_701061 [Trichonephila clavata]
MLAKNDMVVGVLRIQRRLNRDFFAKQIVHSSNLDVPDETSEGYLKEHQGNELKEDGERFRIKITFLPVYIIGHREQSGFFWTINRLMQCI